MIFRSCESIVYQKFVPYVQRLNSFTAWRFSNISGKNFRNDGGHQEFINKTACLGKIQYNNLGLPKI